jgi:hypothetical protein
MAAPYEAPPAKIPPAEIAAWLDSLSPDQRRAVMLSPTTYDKVADEWHTLTPEKKAALYSFEPSTNAAPMDLSDMVAD